MYTLRKILTGGVELNISLGPSYQVISQKKSDVFRETVQKRGFADNSPIAAIVINSIDDQYPVWEDEPAYIMSPDGSTFSRLN